MDKTEANTTGPSRGAGPRPLLAAEDFGVGDLTLRHEVVALPLFARLYRNAFKSGAGPDLPRLKQLVHRLGYYGLGAILRRPQWGVMRLDVRGQSRDLRFNCLNRQFMTLYFQKYAPVFEPTVGAAVLAVLSEDGVFYDIGSNWGYFSLLVASRPAFRGSVQAFEPWPPSFADLASIIEQAELTGIITAHPCALAETSRAGAMRSGRHSGLAHLVVDGDGLAVQTHALDDLPLPPPNVIKMDVEGFEPAVLRGGERTIRAAEPYLIFESALDNPGVYDVLRLLESWHYRLFVPALAPVAGDAAAGVLTDEVPPAADRLRLALHPLTSRTRPLHRAYLNLLACPASRVSQIEGLVQAS